MTEHVTRYARSGDVHVAYQVSGSGPLDLVFVPGIASHLEYQWEEPLQARFFRRLESFARLIRFDKRGAGLSDRVPIGTLEERMDDVRAVMDAAGCTRAALLGLSEGGTLSFAFAATYPQRTAAIVIWNSFARFLEAPDYPFGRSSTFVEVAPDKYSREWGSGSFASYFVPSAAGDQRFHDWWTRFERLAMSPGAAVDAVRWVMHIDARDILPAVRVPTLVLHMRDDERVPPSAGRYLAQRIAGAKYIELAGADHFAWPQGDAVAAEVEEFLTGVRREPETDRVLATLLFTDIVGSTQCASRLGDHEWTGLLQRHHELVRRELARFRGRELRSTGDGFFATFDGPARAIRCACNIRDHVRGLGIEIRAGLHTGEVELHGDAAEGIAVHIAARLAALAHPGEVVASSTVKDLTAGAGIAFTDRGRHPLRGVPGQWQLHAVEG
jgi:class 3 adenylate cyclase